MPESFAVDALARLRAAADLVQAGWLPTEWRRVSGPGPDRYSMKPIRVVGLRGQFEEPLALAPGTSLAVECDLDLPAEIAGVPTAGDPLEMSVWSLFPTSLHHVAADGVERSLLEDEIPVAASGPALLTVVPALAANGDPNSNGKLRAEVHPFDNEVYKQWNWFSFTTPGLRARFELLDVAWAQLSLADALASSDEERKAVEAAARLVPDQCTTSDEAGLTRALHDMAEALAPVAGKVESLKVHLIGHSHIDMNWLWTWPDTVQVIRRDFRSILALMDDYPEMHFTHSQPATYVVVRDEEPELFEKVKAHIASGRWEPATLQWVEGDTNMASSEATARHFLESVAFSRDELGVEPRVILAPDTFGHAGNLPQVAASAGTRVYYHHRCNPGRPFGTSWPAYWWEGQDGTRVLGVTSLTYSGQITAGNLATAALEWGHRKGLPTGIFFYGVGDHGGGPTRESLDTLRRLQALPLLPSAQCSTLQNYADDVVTSGAALPVHRGESTTTFEGCYTTHADTKLFNREGENLLQTAESLAAIAGVDHRAGLSNAWRTVLFNQFHDILDGSAIAEVYRDQAVEHDAVRAAAAKAIDDALDVLQSGAPAGSIAVTNPLAWERFEPVSVDELGLPDGALVAEAEDGTTTPAQSAGGVVTFLARVPAFSTVAYTLRAAEPGEVPADLHAERLTIDTGSDIRDWFDIETPVFKVRVRADSGVVVSLFDKRTGRELVPNGLMDFRPELGFGVLQLLDERPHPMSSWDMREVHNEQSLLSGAEVRVVESGPVRMVLESHHSVRHSSVTCRLVTYRSLARLDFELDVDWQEPGNAEVGVPDLKLSFNGRTRRPQAWYETPFGAVERSADGMEVPALRWAAVVGEDGGFAVLNDSKYGHDVLGTRLRATVVRTAYDPDPASDIGRHRCSFSLVPLTGDWRDAAITQQAQGFNQKLLARRVERAQEGGRVGELGAWRPSISEGPVVAAVVKVARQGRGRVLRLYESTGRAATTELAGVADNAEVWEITVAEDRVQRLDVESGRVHLAFRPWQVRTILVEAAQ